MFRQLHRREKTGGIAQSRMSKQVTEYVARVALCWTTSLFLFLGHRFHCKCGHNDFPPLCLTPLGDQETRIYRHRKQRRLERRKRDERECRYAGLENSSTAAYLDTCESEPCYRLTSSLPGTPRRLPPLRLLPVLPLPRASELARRRTSPSTLLRPLPLRLPFPGSMPSRALSSAVAAEASSKVLADSASAARGEGRTGRKGVDGISPLGLREYFLIVLVPWYNNVLGFGVAERKYGTAFTTPNLEKPRWLSSSYLRLPSKVHVRGSKSRAR